MTPSGLLISWATPDATWPIDASRWASTSAAWRAARSAPSIEGLRQLGQLVVAGQPDPGVEVAGAEALGARVQRRDRPRDRAHEVAADRDRQHDRQREAGDDHDPGPGADALGARAARRWRARASGSARR
jgi:hypothetical protein